MRFRIYADDTVVPEDEFSEWDNATPYYDDYAEVYVPDQVMYYLVDSA